MERKMRTLKISLLVFILSITISAQWEWQNPKPQGNDLVDIQSITNNLNFACGKHGTVLKTTTGGEEWLVLPFPKRIDLLSLCFINPTIGWVTGKKDSIVYLYKTIDSGDTWTKQLEVEAELISSFFIDEFEGWLGIDSTLFRTTDGGNTWTQLLIPGPITDVFFYDTEHGWVASRDWSPHNLKSKIYSTTDGGNTWQYTIINDPTVSRITFVNLSLGWLIGVDNFGPNVTSARVWNTTNGGITWQQQLEIGGWGYYYIFTDLDFINESIGWAATLFGKSYKTTDSGNSWVEVNNVYLLNQIAPITEQLLLGCGRFGVNYISIDGGLTWVKNFEGEILNDTWELFVLNEDFCFSGGEDALMKTSNGGENWSKIELNVPGQQYLNARAIWFGDLLNGWLGLEYLGGHGGLLKTSDGGTTWTVQVDSIHRVFDICFFNNTLGWFGSGKKIYHTSDAGNNWFAQAEVSQIAEIMAVQFASANVGWAGGYVGLFKTIDGGNNWEQAFPTGINLYTYGIHFVNPLEGWVIGDGGLEGDKIFKTSDGGQTWEDRSYPISRNSRLKALYFKDINNGWVVGWDEYSNALILHTTSGGSYWEILDFPTSHALTNIGFANENIGWVLGSAGIILHTTNGGVSFLEDEVDANNSNEFLLSQNYPNPFNPITKIKYEIPGQARNDNALVTLKVYDILGSEIATLVNEEKPSGEYEVEFNAASHSGNVRNLPSGIYFYQLKAGQYSETKKMVLLK
jgi:photosystem II stability/assembly factor-like uncharacterized protein